MILQSPPPKDKMECKWVAGQQPQNAIHSPDNNTSCGSDKGGGAGGGVGHLTEGVVWSNVLNMQQELGQPVA